MKTRSSTFILLPLLLAYLWGSLGIFTSNFLDYHRNDFQRLVRESMEHQTHLAFTKAEFKLIHWEEAGEEFEWEGKMYDVSGIDSTDSSFMIHCVHDEFEDAILDFFKMKAPQSGTAIAKGKIQPIYFQHVSFSNSIQTSVKVFYLPVKDQWTAAQVYEIPSPPPRSALIS